MTTEQWERENQDTLMEYFIDGDPSVRRIQCEHCRKIIYTQTIWPECRYIITLTCFLHRNNSFWHGVVTTRILGRTFTSNSACIASFDNTST